ncbi:hypothetical protein N6H14_06910 [Paenibacillus sp. CC-CFT747]|nr:hypothetical protein N6H14_06910 [Paenibacillus sp. CC-CFT747]
MLIFIPPAPFTFRNCGKLGKTNVPILDRMGPSHSFSLIDDMAQDRYNHYTSKQFKFDELKASGALLLGRETYVNFAAAWPSLIEQEGDMAG